MKHTAKWLALALLLCSVGVGTAWAADHLDSPGASNDPLSDINDVYVFRSQAADAVNTSRTVFVMTIAPLAGEETRFSPNVDYNFWIRERGTDNRLDITCTATEEPDQEITCTGPNGATAAVGFNAVEAGDGLQDMRVFAGLRDDPFFFDLDAFFTVVGDPSQVGILLDDEGTDFFQDLNTLSIVVDVKNEIFGQATLLEVYAFTTRNGQDR